MTFSGNATGGVVVRTDCSMGLSPWLACWTVPDCFRRCRTVPGLRGALWDPPGSPGDGQLDEGGHGQIGPPRDLVLLDREAEAGEPLQEAGQRDLQLQARERRPDAVVDAVPEGDVRVARPAHVQRVRLREDPRVAVGGH